jgi:hypothetical protein
MKYSLDTPESCSVVIKQLGEGIKELISFTRALLQVVEIEHHEQHDDCRICSEVSKGRKIFNLKG